MRNDWDIKQDYDNLTDCLDEPEELPTHLSKAFTRRAYYGTSQCVGGHNAQDKQRIK